VRAALVLISLVAACAAAAASLVRQQALVRQDAARAAEVAALEQRLDALEARNDKLVGRLGAAETTLRRKEQGIAPLATRVLRSVFTVETDRGFGSGFVAWQENGASFVLTAYHVVEDSSAGVTISRKNGSWAGQVVGVDPKNDLALVRVSGRPANAEPLWQNAAPNRPRAGDQLLLIGSPFGLYGTVTTGVVSRVARTEIQTDAAANPGNSGGPALMRDGKIVGVLVSGAGENVNFAVPIDLVCEKLRDC
jgi:S1-C subfamily serine protease